MHVRFFFAAATLVFCVGMLPASEAAHADAIGADTTGADTTGAEDRRVERKPIVIQARLDFGQVVEGSNQDIATNGPIEFVPIQRTGIGLIQEATIGRRLDVRVGVAGLFWYPWPQLKESPHTEIVKFGPGIQAADATYRFGDPDRPSATAQFGYFPYRYNQDAANLGEYLYRSTTYPGVLFTGGWSFINNGYKATGARFGFSHLGGAFTHDFTAFFESDAYPFLSLSPGWVGAWRIGKVAEFGAGVVFQHLIPMKPSQLTPHDPLSTYVRMKDFPAIRADTGRAVIGNLPDRPVTNCRGHAGGPIEGIEQELMSMKIPDPGDPSKTVQPYYAAANGIDTLYLGDSDPLPAGYAYLYARDKTYLTFRGIKTMARFSLDFKPLLGLDGALGPQDLRLFGEAAILGVQDQPFYYEDISKRIPIMLGFNLPAFHLLDLLSVQAEYYGLDFADSEEKSFVNNLPVYQVPNNKVRQHFSDLRTGDDLKWSVYAKRNLFTGLNLYVQAASDHLRLQDYNSRRSAQPVVNRPSEWYYLLRIEAGI
ncbi:MAG: hypothetical protein JWP91_1273 [Fibrobacteres bacterium]|nr:hypothetical protein [Fibrobacterota bacterium]